ncbi:MAG TPA: M1 family metallopeptidase [Longimicrobiaceae bacterium]|nr:M1 family metallopeptidase [Longimicrobiaceae bacterium]
MRRTSKLAALVFVAAVSTPCAAHAQAGASQPASASAASDTSTRLVRPVPVTHAYQAALAAGTRTATGQPGGAYWQQRVSYRIDAELDPATALLRGRERVVYHNRSPRALPFIALNLYQNIFTPGVPRNRTVPVFNGGVTLESVAVGGAALADRSGEAATNPVSPGYVVRGTLARLNLPHPLASGDSLVLDVAWHHTVPPKGAFRTGWEDALGGRVLQVAQWYPQIATYDDVRGWDETPYLGDGEFFLEYGDFDVSLTLPAGWLVGGTGTLRNPEQVLTAAERTRLASAARSDSALAIVTEADLRNHAATAAGTGGRLTWRFSASDVRDFGFCASDRYLWDAGRVAIPTDGGGTRDVMVHSLYRPGAPGWERGAKYGQHAIGFLSRRIMPYIYPQVTVSEGPIFGMEYPMLVFIARPEAAADLQSVIAHEVGHQWFPMMVGSDEASFAWMDEGINSWDEDEMRADFFPGTDPWAETRTTYLRVAGKDNEVPLMRHTDLVSPYGARTVAAYTKPAVVMRSLRAVVGTDAFNRAMTTYAREWRLKHPYPWDFFHTVERVSGQKLDWFFYPWWFETGTLDQAIASVRPVDGGVEVTVRDFGQIAMPTTVVVTGDNGATTEAEIPVSAWLGGHTRTVTVTVPAMGRATRVELDPRQLFPDVDRANNVWPFAPAPPNR